jgi:hypothetical protein
MREAYERHGSVRAAAEELKISTRSLSKYLRDAGVSVKRGARKGNTLKVHHHACLAKWLRDNPTTPLPRDVKQIAEITGCTRSSVSSYLKRRRDALSDEAQNILNQLIEKGAVIRDTYERKLPLKSVDDYTLVVNRFSEKIQVNFNIRPSGKVTFLFDIELLRRMK